MDRKIDSDVTMVANDAFTKILSCIQESGLNYKIEMSPFSANISIKRSLARNLSGFPVLPTVLKKEANISVHDRELCEMRKSYEERLKVAYETIEALQIDMNDTIKKNESIFSSKISSKNSTASLWKNSIDDAVKKKECSVECRVVDSDIFKYDAGDTGGYFFSSESGTKHGFHDKLV